MEKYNSIHVALSIDNRVIYQTLVFLTSLFENRSQTTIYDIIIMICDNMNKGHISKINSLKDKYGDKFIKIQFINMKNYFQGTINDNHNPITSYYRIELPSLLPKNDRVIYIDVEVLNFGDLTEMYNLELKNDIYLRGVLGGIELIDDLKSLGINSTKFFNSEIILMNLKSMRINGVENKTKNFINSHNLDNYQTAINAICYNNWEILPLKYAIFSFNEYEDLVKFYRNKEKRYMYNETELKQGFYHPTLLHYNGSVKPWDKRYYSQNKTKGEYWWYYAKLSGFYDEILQNFGFNKNDTDNLIEKIPEDGGLIKNNYKPMIKIAYLNNNLKFPYHENNINFSEYSTSIKPIALYLPKITLMNSFEDFSRNLTENGNETDNGDKGIKKKQNIEREIELAKSHGIYGFGIYYYSFSNLEIYNDPLDIIFENKNIDFHYLLIWKNKDIINNDKKYLIKDEYNEKNFTFFIDKISKYLLDQRYIKINDCPMIGIYSPTNISNINQMISIWRARVNKYGIKNIIILGFLNNVNIKLKKGEKPLDSYAYIHSYNNLPSYIMNSKKIYHYYGLIYNNRFKKSYYKIFKSAILPFEIKNNNKESIFYDYTPYKFYILNKDIIDYTKKNFDNNNQFYFINSFNNFLKKDFFEKDGYASLNSLSKALFKIKFSTKEYDLQKLKNMTQIAIQTHIFFIDLLEEIMSKINNIPVKYDLYVTTTAEKNKNTTESYIKSKLKNKPNKYQILVVENKGRDVLPFLTQFSKVFKNYKYFCHIHSKKTTKTPNLGIRWRRYLFNNLLGNAEIISEILNIFETSEKIGIIYPDNYYELLGFAYKNTKENLKHMNFLLMEISHRYIYDISPEFIAGNMFWARVSAVYQIFQKVDIISLHCPLEKGQRSHTILHGIERLWLPLVQYNGYNYTTFSRIF